MKKLLLLVAVMAMAMSASAQLSWGVKGGMNGANIGGDADGDIKISIYLGAFAEIPLAGNWAFQPELVYSRQGAAAGDINMRFNYINVPLLAKFYVLDKWSIEAGPQVGFLLNAKLATDGNSVKIPKEMYKSIDVSIGLGTSYNITDNIGISARYNFGLTNVIDPDWLDVNVSGAGGDLTSPNNVFQIGAYYKF